MFQNGNITKLESFAATVATDHGNTYYRAKKERKTCGTNGTMKHLERFKKMINLAIKLDWLEKSPFQNYKLKFEKNERQFLSGRELKMVEETYFKSESLERVNDMFIFSCYTGLTYGELKVLTKDHIVKGIDGKNWIYTKREKTNEPLKVPLLHKADTISKKYRKKGWTSLVNICFR